MGEHEGHDAPDHVSPIVHPQLRGAGEASKRHASAGINQQRTSRQRQRCSGSRCSKLTLGVVAAASAGLRGLVQAHLADARVVGQFKALWIDWGVVRVEAVVDVVRERCAAGDRGGAGKVGPNGAEREAGRQGQSKAY